MVKGRIEAEFLPECIPIGDGIDQWAMKKDYVPVFDGLAGIDEPAFVEAFWTRIWDGHSAENFTKARIETRDEFRVMEPYISKLPPKARILDGGCGLGEWTLYYVSRGFDVIGLDISCATIERLRSKFPRVQFVAGDIRNTHFNDEHFDAYFSWGTFEHFEEGLGPCLREGRRILKKGGYLFISVPFQNRRHLWRDRRSLWFWDEKFDRERGYSSEMRFYQWRLTKPELQREFEINGFRALKIEAIHKWHGLHRAIKHELRAQPGTKWHRILQMLLYPIVPKNYVAHMIMGVGQKR